MTQDSGSGAGVTSQQLSRSELDLELSPSKHAKDATGTLERHIRETTALADNPLVDAHLGIPYGDRPRQTFDLYRPKNTSGIPPCVAFVHGGFWQEGSIAGAGFAGAELASNGWALATLGYTLAPAVRLRDIVAEVADGVVTLANRLGMFGIDSSRLVLAGHSAGAHLIAAVLAGQGGERAARAASGAILISGVYDLHPIAASYVNDIAKIDDIEAAELSPLFAKPESDIPVQLLIGEDEPQAFQAQTDALHDAWKPTLTDLSLTRAPGRDHFDILDELAPATQRLHLAAAHP